MLRAPSKHTQELNRSLSLDMLHDPARHEPLASAPWDEAAVRAAIERIVCGAEAGFVEGHGWPAHPRDVDVSADPLAAAQHSLYFGSAGMVWALQHLRDTGAAALRRDYGGILDELLALNRAQLGDEPADRRSWLFGDTPILLMRYARRPSEEGAATIAATIAANEDHPARELMWGAPGTLLAALFLHEREGGERWATLVRRGARTLLGQLAWSDEHRCAAWPQRLYGRAGCYLDAVHGFVATASVLLRALALLEPAEQERCREVVENTIRRTAIVEDGGATWPTELGEDPRIWKRLMQFCHGAPGFVVCLARLPGTATDELLAAAGEATWRAGPLRKGSNLCHGTAGNGYAFLVLHARTGEARWLERARAFAMHAIAQCDAEAEAVGRPRHSLWTGDIGLALYLRDCLRARAEFPTLDVF
jgi:hypothetical protein